jgi:hypothetical protein
MYVGRGLLIQVKRYGDRHPYWMIPVPVVATSVASAVSIVSVVLNVVYYAY